MSKDALEVLSAEQAGRIDRIKTYHKQFADTAKDTAKAAMLCGFELTVLKEVTPHGQFLKLQERYFPEITARTSQRYMALISGAKDKNDTVSHLIQEAVADPQKALAAPKDAQLEKAFHELADGATVTDLYRGAGVIRQPDKPGGFRPDARAVEKWLKENHPDLAGKSFADLPADIQAAFKKQYKPKIDPKLVAESKRQKADDLLADLGTMLTEQEFKKYWTPEQRKLAKTLFWDFHQALSALDKKAAKKK